MTHKLRVEIQCGGDIDEVVVRLEYDPPRRSRPDWGHDSLQMAVDVARRILLTRSVTSSESDLGVRTYRRFEPRWRT